MRELIFVLFLSAAMTICHCQLISSPAPASPSPPAASPSPITRCPCVCCDADDITICVECGTVDPVWNYVAAGAALFFLLVIAGVLFAKHRAHRKMKGKIDAVEKHMQWYATEEAERLRLLEITKKKEEAISKLSNAVALDSALKFSASSGAGGHGGKAAPVKHGKVPALKLSEKRHVYGEEEDEYASES